MKRCPARVRDFASRLSKWLNRETASGGAWGVLAREDIESWTQGGCWILAEALHRWLGAPMWAVIIEGRDWGPTVSHVVVRVGDCFLDGDGAWTEEGLIRTEGTWRVYQTDVEISVGPFDASGTEGLLCPAGAVTAIHEGLERNFGNGPSLLALLEEAA